MTGEREIQARSTVDAAPAPRPDDPPGMAAIRRFFRHPFFQGIWLWLRAIGRGVRAVWKWLDKNAGPIARGIEQAGNVAVRASEGAAKVGHAAKEIGVKVGEWGRDRRDATGAQLRRIGRGMRRIGNRATRVASRSGEVAESVEDLGKGLASLTGDDGESKPRTRRPPARKVETRLRPRPERSAPAIPSPTPATPAPIPPSPELEPDEAPRPDADPDGELPEVFRERIRALGKRKRSKPLRALILDICAYRRWTTVGQLSNWLGMDTSNLQRRHLRPMLKSGRLRLRYPDSRSHPDQGYRAAGV